MLRALQVPIDISLTPVQQQIVEASIEQLSEMGFAVSVINQKL